METFRTVNNKTGKKISVKDLTDFLKDNLNTISKIDIVDFGTIHKSSKHDETCSRHIVCEKDDVTDASIKPAKSFLDIGEIDKLTSFPVNLSNIFLKFEDRFAHMGTIHHFVKFEKINLENEIDSNLNKDVKKLEQVDISFYASVFSCLRQSFSSANQETQSTFIQKFLDLLKRDIAMGDFATHGYSKLKWNKQDFIREVNKQIVTYKIMKYICDYLHVNIFILDFNDDALYFVGGNYVPFKKNMFIIKRQFYEPMFTERGKIFGVKDDLINLVIKNKKYVKSVNYNEKVKEKYVNFDISEEDLSKYIDMAQFDIKKDDDINRFDETENIENIKNDTKEDASVKSVNSDKDEIYSDKKSIIEKKDDEDSSEDEEFTAVNLTSKNKLTEIQEVARKLKIPIQDKSGKRRTKEVLLTEIKKKN